MSTAPYYTMYRSADARGQAANRLQSAIARFAMPSATLPPLEPPQRDSDRPGMSGLTLDESGYSASFMLRGWVWIVQDGILDSAGLVRRRLGESAATHRLFTPVGRSLGHVTNRKERLPASRICWLEYRGDHKTRDPNLYQRQLDSAVKFRVPE